MNNPIYEYIIINYDFDEPILSDDIRERFYNIPSGTIRQILKRLCDKGTIKRVAPGIYFKPNPNSLLKRPVVSISEIISEKYIFKNAERIGYRSGINFANKLGLTSQTASIETIVSNEVSDKKRIVNIKKNRIIVTAPKIKVNNMNYKLLQILDLLYNFEQNSEIELYEAENYIKRYLDDLNLSIYELDECVSKYPLQVQVKFYKTGVYYEFTRRQRGF